MPNPLQAVVNFIRPIVVIYSSIAGLVTFLLGALADPQGWMNSMVVGMIDAVAHFWPSTPDSLKISTFLDAAADQMPLVGRAIVYDVFNTMVAMVAIAVVIKIYKLIPFKAT